MSRAVQAGKRGKDCALEHGADPTRDPRLGDSPAPPLTGAGTGKVAREEPAPLPLLLRREREWDCRREAMWTDSGRRVAGGGLCSGR